MSTRCHIIIEDPRYGDRTILYRHSDGYPEGEHGVLASLAPFVARFMKHRGWDPEYLAAQIICDQINTTRNYRRKLLEERLAQLESDEDAGWLLECTREQLANVDNNFLGFGISNEIHGDVEFIYRVTPEGIFVEYPDGERLTTTRQAKMLLEGRIPKKFKE